MTSLAPCGTVMAYRRHCREAKRMNRKVTCTECLAANATRTKTRRAAMDRDTRSLQAARWYATKQGKPAPTVAPSLRPAPCGTRAAYVRHAREAKKVGGQVSCEACLAENRRVSRERRAALAKGKAA